MRKLFSALFLLFPSLLLAQLTQVSGTITDPNGLPYSNGTISATLVISGTPRFTFNSLPYTPPNQPVGLNAAGSFVMSLADVTQLTPSGGTWSFHVCSAQGTVQPGSPISNGPVCFDTVGLIISGSSQNISAPLSAAAPKLSTVGGGAAVTNPITVPSPTGSLPSIAGSAGLGWQLNATCCATAGVPSIWAVAANSPGTSWFPIPYIVVNGLTPANLSAQNFVSTTAPPANGINVIWSRTGPTGANSSQQQISAAIVGDGAESDCLKGTAAFDDCLGGNRTRTATCSGTTGTCTATFGGFSANPTCVATPTTTGVTSFFVSATTTTSVTVTYSPSTTDSFQFLCFGPT